MLFGRMDQARLILEETFEGKQFFVKGANKNKIDCMFFPCTNRENVTFDYGAPLKGWGDRKSTRSKSR